MSEIQLRSALIRAGERLQALRLSRGTSGNISARFGKAMLISASAAEIGQLKQEDLVLIEEEGIPNDEQTPSSEWRMHRDVYVARPEFSAVVHTHSPAATALACLRKEIPPFHYMVVRLGGANVRCSRYATFGTQELSDRVVEALTARKACLVANHGMIAAGENLAEAVRLAAELEDLARLYLDTLTVGKPVLLTSEELHAVEQQFSDLRYGL